MAHAIHVCRGSVCRAWTVATHRVNTIRYVAAPPARHSMTRSVIVLSFSTTAPARSATPKEPESDGAADLGATTESKSSCPAGTVLNGLNYYKGRTDPVAKADDEYPDWLWKCLDVTKRASDEADADVGDEFSKSKKQRRLAMKRQRELEAKVLATGDLSILAPKIPLHHQTINLPIKAEAPGDGSERAPDAYDDALVAEEKRRELRVAMRKARRAKIKEDNYLRSM